MLIEVTLFLLFCTLLNRPNITNKCETVTRKLKKGCCALMIIHHVLRWRLQFQSEWMNNVKYCLDTLHISIKLSFLFTCFKVKTLGYNMFYCSTDSFKKWQNATIVKSNVFIEQLVNKHFWGIKLCELIL
jgi:hypothetical protein